MRDKLVSYCIFTYNQEKYIRDAILSAFQQDYDPLEIIICDDCSTDSTVEIIDSLINGYKGHHKIIFNRNDHNVGIRENVNKAVYDLSSGEIIVFAAGDDVSIPSRTADYVNFFELYPQVMSVSCKSDEVDKDLHSIGGYQWDKSFSIYTVYDYISFRDFIIYPGDSRAVRRRVAEAFPKLLLSNDEDYAFFIRSLMLGSNLFIRYPYVKHRNHSNNISHKRNLDYSNLIAQVENDISFALTNRYISSKTADLLLNKFHHVIDVFNIYWNSPFSSPRNLFYRLLHKFFKVTLE